MIPYNDQIKINDFKRAFKIIMNPSNNKDINEIIDALFYNVERNYEEYYSTVPYVFATKEQYKFHILKPVNGRYSLLDFLLNRAISNIDCIYPSDENAYNHAKILLINTKRYEKERSKYSDDFIIKQYQKSKLHESGHALHIWDTIRDNSIHSRDTSPFYPNFIGFKQKLQGFERILGSKYSNMLHSSEVQNVPQAKYSSVNTSYPFTHHNIDEAVTEYFATKYSGLYGNVKDFGFYYVSNKPQNMAIVTPNHLNGYAHSSHFIYHLENLVSKPAMFESTFFESDAALREFSTKYASHIEHVWSKNSASKEMPNYTDTFSKFNYLFQTACKPSPTTLSEDDQRKTMTAYQLLDWIFIFAYKQEFNNGHIPKKRMMDIAELSYYFSPIFYDSVKKEWINSPIKDWYNELYKLLKKPIGNEEQSPTGR